MPFNLLKPNGFSNSHASTFHIGRCTNGGTSPAIDRHTRCLVLLDEPVDLGEVEIAQVAQVILEVHRAKQVFQFTLVSNARPSSTASKAVFAPGTSHNNPSSRAHRPDVRTPSLLATTVTTIEDTL